MSLLLHLSDLHLANTPQEDAVGDYKVEAVPERDRVSRARLLRHTLKALSTWLSDSDETLAGVIITGDITTRGHPEGFGGLPGLLEALGDALPEPGRIVVVPGNHDVAWDTPPGSAERYRAFIDGIRRTGYVTPLLDGIDYDGDQPRSIAGPLLSGHDFAVVAINSADMCGALEPFSPEAESELGQLSAGRISDSLQAEIRRVRRYDMPRISPRQMAALADLVDQVPAGRVRIAALHHQLAPVREEEEVKPFESIVNLGAFSAFLSDAQVDVILHGHKHADQVLTVPLSGAAHDRRFAVVASCGTVGGMAATGREIAKLIRIDSALPTLRRVEICAVPAVNAGRKLTGKIRSLYNEPTWRSPATTPVVVISGATASYVHEQLLETARQAGGKPVRDLICVIDRGLTAVNPPDTYPPLPRSTTTDSGWFNDIVDWWQDPRRADGKPFTHGQRLRDWPGTQGRDQIEAIIEILRRDPGTSRGIAVLVNPDTDNIADTTINFPSFSLLHLWIDNGALHCSAFFRKQEMTYWWPVNAAEIARIQAHVLQALRSSHQELTEGTVRTHASEAVFSGQLPKVNVPRIDRWFWHDPDSLRVLAVAIADPHMADREKDIAVLMSLMDEWAPQAGEPPTDGAPLPTRGLSALADMLAALADRYPTSPAREVGELLREMVEANALYPDKRVAGDRSRTFGQWRNPQLRRLTRVRELLAPHRVSPAVQPTSPADCP